MSKIEWTNETWNPIIGCSEISTGCRECYAKTMAYRLMHMPHGADYQFVLNDNGEEDPEKFINLPEWNGQTHFQKSQIEKPLHWKKARMIFVVSMGDLFHESVSFDDIDKVIAIIAICKQHTFQILTKRAERMREYFESAWQVRIIDHIKTEKNKGVLLETQNMALPNVWLGVTAENQDQADKRIPILLSTPAIVRFVSIEPMLSEIDLTNYISTIVTHYKNQLDWVICGGESGSKARPMHPDWVSALRDQCKEAKVPFFFKQWGELLPKCQSILFQRLNQKVFKSPNNPDKLNTYYKIGKKRAGRLLDGKEHNEMPTNN